MKVLVSGHHLYRDGRLIEEVFKRVQSHSQDKLRILPGIGKRGSLAKRVAHRVGYTLLEPPKVDKNTSTHEQHKVLLDANKDINLILIFHDDYWRSSKRSQDLVQQAKAMKLDIVLVDHPHGTDILN